MGCLYVRGDNPRALASGLSYVQVDKHGITILYNLHQCRPCTSRDISRDRPKWQLQFHRFYFDVTIAGKSMYNYETCTEYKTCEKLHMFNGLYTSSGCTP